MEKKNLYFATFYPAIRYQGANGLVLVYSSKKYKSLADLLTALAGKSTLITEQHVSVNILREDEMHRNHKAL